MTLRKALCASPLAVVVAILAHFATFGLSHVPGTTHSADVFSATAVGLGLAMLVPFVSGFAGRERVAGVRPWIGPLVLALAGVVTFGAIEAGEGHASFATVLQAACAALPIAFATAFFAKRAAHVATAAGRYAGAFVRRNSCEANRAVTTLLRASRKTNAQALFTRGPRPGRAPPISL